MPNIVSSNLESLAALAHPEGGWGYAPGRPAHLEPTCLALLALSMEPERFQAQIENGRQFLNRCACPDGTYRVPGSREEAAWPTALVLFVQAALGYPDEDRRRTAAGLLSLKGRVPEDPKDAEMMDIDFRLVGWPWATDNFSWAEPTAWSCLALRRAGWGKHPRVEEGLRLLLDRASDKGGINYGNRHVFGRATEVTPEPTATMLMASQGTQHPRLAAAVGYLTQQALNSDDLEILCLARLALDSYERSPDFHANLDQRILASYQARAQIDWLKPAPRLEALTALALSAGRNNFFRLDQTERSDAPAPAISQPRQQHPGLSTRIRSFFRGLALEGAGKLRPIPKESSVHIAAVGDYNGDLAGVLRRQYEAFRASVPLAGKRIVLKPNLVEYHRDKVINTDPRLIAAVIELCRHEGAAEVIVAEGPGHWRNVEHIVSASGLGDVLKHFRVPFVDLNHDEPVKSLNLGRLTGLDYLYLSRTVTEAEVLISLPKLKTHHWAGATLSLKNLFGTLPGICYGWPKNELHWRGIHNSIVDIALTRTPDLAIVDGIVGMEGDGPLNGTPKALGVVIMGVDPIAVDATCCRLMQLDPCKVGYLVLGQQKRVGLLRAEEIRQIGERIEALAQPFETLPHFRELYMGRSA